MLSRFKLPGLSTFLGNQSYPREAVDEAITQIKSVGKSVNPGNDDSLEDISKILVLMRRFGESLPVQRVGCHALSNLAMQVVAARWIIQKGGFQVIRKCIVRFRNDHKVCWLASSAVWNLGRPPANRPAIGREGVKLMLEILGAHRDKEKVANTAIGALSNLSLQDELKELIAEESSLRLLVAVMTQQLAERSVSVLTSGAGLLANLAVSDDFAARIVKRGALSILMRLLTWRANDQTLHRNTCAALNNLVTAEGFLAAFLRARGIERVYDFLHGNSEELYANLLENCLVNLDADSNVRTTSLHLSAFHGEIGVLRDIFVKEDPALDATDGHRRTALDYALAAGHADIVRFLCRCGAKVHSRSQLSPEMREAMDTGIETLRKVQTLHCEALLEALPHFPEHLCQYMAGFHHTVDMLTGMRLY